MYHCVPRIISGLSQISALSWKTHDRRYDDREEQIGGKGGEELHDRLDAMREARACRPIQTPIGTQMTEASAISTKTRISVTKPKNTTCSTSLTPTSA